MESPKKRKASTELVSNPYIKKRNLEWRISPPPFADGSKGSEESGASEDSADIKIQEPKAAADTAPNNNAQVRYHGGDPSESALVENNTLRIEDHLAYFSNLLTKRALDPYPADQPRLSIPRYQSLYQQSLGSRHGAHFVVTQHDHPIAGPHYDLRLQINETSSCSWAIMYGLPGDPNSRGRSGRTGDGTLRNATETRVHCLWNHLVETAGAQTGSLMVWDSGQYEVLPRRSKHAPLDSQEAAGAGGGWDRGAAAQQERLAAAFSARKIRLRLHGTRLPRGYALNLRLTKDEDAVGRARADGPGRPRRSRRLQRQGKPVDNGPETSSDSDVDTGSGSGQEAGGGKEEDEYQEGSSTVRAGRSTTEMEKEIRDLEDEQVRRTNAYTGAVNTIGSVHQRKWFLSLDRDACGFEKSRKGGKVWWEKMKGEGGDKGQVYDGDAEHRYEWPFHVRGPDSERSVVTGRLGADILKDEGVVGHVRRKGWRPILG